MAGLGFQHGGGSFWPDRFQPVLYGNLRKTRLGSLCRSEKNKTETPPNATAPPFLFCSWGFSSANLHQKETRAMMVKKLIETRNEKGFIKRIFEFWPRQLGRALLAFSGSLVGLSAPIWAWGGLEFNSKWKGENFYLFGVNGSSGAAVTVADLFLQRLVYFFGRLSSSSLIPLLAAKVLVPFEEKFKYSSSLNLDCPFEVTWSIFSCWISFIWRIDLTCTIWLNPTIRLRLKRKRIWAVGSVGTQIVRMDVCSCVCHVAQGLATLLTWRSTWLNFWKLCFYLSFSDFFLNKSFLFLL